MAIWKRTSYGLLMLYYNIINSSRDRLAKQIVQQQRAQNYQNMLFEKLRTIEEKLNIKLNAVVKMIKSKWKKYKIKLSVKFKIRKQNGKQNETNRKKNQEKNKGIHCKLWQWPNEGHYKN